MNNIKFGIVVPFYGVEKYIGKCLDSLVNQTYRNFTAVLVDDESKDGSRKIADEYVHKHPELFMLIEEKNQGQGEARNYGFKNLPDDIDYFLFLDSDDYLDNTLLEKAAKVLSKDRCDILTYNFQEMDTEGHIFGVYNLCENKTGTVPAEDLKKYISSTICVQGRIYSKEFWSEIDVRFPKRIWFEDAAIVTYVLSKCRSMYLLNESLYFYIQREGSVMNNNNLEKMMDIKKALDCLKDLFTASNTFERFKEEIEVTYAQAIINTINRLNMYEKGSKLQSELSEYLFSAFPNCCDNKNINEENLDKLKMIKDKKFTRYFFRYSIKPKVNSMVKAVIPKGIVTFYRNRKYS